MADAANSTLPPSSHARAAVEQLYQFCRVTRWAFANPAETSEQFAERATLVGALPRHSPNCRAFSALADQALSMDSMTEETDPTLAIDSARLQLDEARGLAVDLYKLLDAAHNTTAHVLSEGQRSSSSQ